jgi:hypothetical protein
MNGPSEQGNIQKMNSSKVSWNSVVGREAGVKNTYPGQQLQTSIPIHFRYTQLG